MICDKCLCFLKNHDDEKCHDLNSFLQSIIDMESLYNSGQYFTTNVLLQEKIYSFILNDPVNILEPCIGQGDLVKYVIDKNPTINFDMYEIDKNIQLLDDIERDKIIYRDFLDEPIKKKYKTIIGNPPYLKTQNGNLYVDFIDKCYSLLDVNGELIFIVPSDFFKKTCASNLLNKMILCGSFTHIYHPHDEKMFKNASIDIIIFRYCKSIKQKTVLYNDEKMYINNSNGLITFTNNNNNNSKIFSDYFNIYVGMVSGKEEVFKNNKLGNIDILNGKDKIDKYICIDKYPCSNKEINKHLLEYKIRLLNRKIRKFNNYNWFEWGALRNISTVRQNIGKKCIFIHNITRNNNVAFVDSIQPFGGGLIMLKPKDNFKVNKLNKVVNYLNSDAFKNNFMFSGRFKIGHRQISNSYIPDTIVK